MGWNLIYGCCNGKTDHLWLHYENYGCCNGTTDNLYLNFENYGCCNGTTDRFGRLNFGVHLRGGNLSWLVGLNSIVITLILAPILEISDITYLEWLTIEVVDITDAPQMFIYDIVIFGLVAILASETRPELGPVSHMAQLHGKIFRGPWSR